ncbi:hypothetical protein ACOMHN_055533 [Nucella lapillus]
MGNPFEEESQDVVKLDTKEIAGPAAVETVMNAKRIGQEQFEALTRECLLDRTKAVDDPIPRNKLKVFSTSTPRSQSKGQQQLASVKNDRELFARMYIGCQTRDGNLEEFFRHENQACPPALSDGGSLCTGTKSDLLTCLEEISDAKTETPVTTCIVLDGAAIIQMLKPAASKTFEEYAQQIVIPYMSTKLQTLIPPTKAALEEHVKRAVYQGGHVWGQILLPAPELPPPTNWGWSRTGEGQYTPYWTRLPEAAHSCIELVSCKCKKGCVRRCKCKKAALQCTAICVCEGDST